jgi:ribonuclease P/MRP protein subunit POP5
MKRILPSLKEKKRYLAFDVISENKFSRNEVRNALKKEALKFLGSLNYGKAGIMMLNNNIIKVNNKFVNHLKTSMMLIKEIDKKKVTLRTMKVSGILKKLREGV